MIEIVSGTNRPGANALKIAHELLGYYREAGAEARVLSLAEMPAEIFDPASYAEKPASFGPIQERVLAADGLHVVTPEYNGSFPGVMKYFIDMLKFPESFEHRPIAFVGEAAGTWGGFRAVEQLQLIFGYRNGYLLPERVWIAGVHKVLDEDGRVADEQVAQRLREQVRAFIAFTRMVRAGSDAAEPRT